MNKIKTKPLILLPLVLLFLFFCVLIAPTQEKIQAATDKESSHEHKPLYQCPMHPRIISHKSGENCAVCGMKLVLVETKDTQEDNDSKTNNDSKTKITSKSQNHFPSDRWRVNLSEKNQQAIGIKVVKVKERELFKSIRAPGRIAFDPELYTAQGEYLEALKQWDKIKYSSLSTVKENAKAMIDSSKIRLKVLGLSDEQIKILTKKRKQTESLLIGGKEQKNWIYADVFERSLPHIKEGLPANISGPFLEGKTLSAKVVSVDQIISTKTRTAKIRLQLLHPQSFIRPDSYVSVNIYAPLGKHKAVPIDAIMDTGKDVFVFVKEGSGKFTPRKVQVLLESDNYAAIASGVSVGEEVVSGGNFMLDSESRLEGVLKGFTQKEKQKKKPGENQ